MSAQERRQELVVVTGASTGIGAATARQLAKHGFHVLAGVRRDVDGDALREENVEPLILDVTDETDVAAIAARVAADPLGRPLRALVNNAGIAVTAPVETVPIPAWRRQFEVNLFGHVAMTQALLPALILSRGSVLNISSVCGKVALIAYGPYAAAKFALEATSDALRREVAAFGVKVVVIEPGGVRTEMARRGSENARQLLADMRAEHRQRYAGLIAAVEAQAKSAADEGVSAEEAAEVIVAAVASARPRMRYTIGRDAAMLTRLARILPDRLLDRLLHRNLRPFYSAVEGQAARVEDVPAAAGP